MNHYGVYVDDLLPTTGVICNHRIEFLGDEIGLNSVDLAWESHIAECKNEAQRIVDQEEQS